MSLEVFKNCGDVALRDIVSGHGGDELRLDWVISEVFSNLNVSVFGITLLLCTHMHKHTATLYLPSSKCLQLL